MGVTYYYEFVTPETQEYKFQNCRVDYGFPAIARLANRVWFEDENGHVKYLKNRMGEGTGALRFAVDMKEFFWIKLKSIPL